MRGRMCLLLAIVCTAAAVAQEDVRVVHVFVALCDNEHQGIVPVPKLIGNGEDCDNNLYWGAMYGLRTHFKRSADWSLVSTEENPETHVLERCVFRHKESQTYLVADAYEGAWIRETVRDFLAAAGGQGGKKLAADDMEIPIAGGADVIAYIGHNGLMDFSLPLPKRQEQEAPKDVVILACKSKSYFEAYLERLDANPVLLTTNFMAPEAYTLEAALAGWMKGESPEDIAGRAAKAYHKYQKCGLNGAKRLFGLTP